MPTEMFFTQQGSPVAHHTWACVKCVSARNDQRCRSLMIRGVLHSANSSPISLLNGTSMTAQCHSTAQRAIPSSWPRCACVAASSAAVKPLCWCASDAYDSAAVATKYELRGVDYQRSVWTYGRSQHHYLNQNDHQRVRYNLGNMLFIRTCLTLSRTLPAHLTCRDRFD